MVTFKTFSVAITTRCHGDSLKVCGPISENGRHTPFVRDRAGISVPIIPVSPCVTYIGPHTGNNGWRHGNIASHVSGVQDSGNNGLEIRSVGGEAGIMGVQRENNGKFIYSSTQTSA